jgi:hypothetical protein
MRRMMHAAAIALCFVGSAQAQNPQTRLASNSSSNPPSLVLGGAESSSNQTMVPAPAVAPPEFIPFGSDRPFSQLAVTMNCHDASPALWSNYASERAAIAARINQHVDGTCKCFDGKCNLHHSACGPCGTGSTCGQGGCGNSCESMPLSKIKKNRYKVPFSSLYSAPSEACCKSCGGKDGCGCGNESVLHASPTSACSTGECATGCQSSGCTSCGQLGGIASPVPGTARVPYGPRVANPPLKRVAEPDQRGPRSAEISHPLPGMQR